MSPRKTNEPLPKTPRRTAPRDGRAARAADVGDASDLRCSSFPPVIAPGCRLLVLGSMPGVQSLRAQQYYFHPQNLFWRFMAELFDAGREHPYEERLARLKARGVGLWDSLAHCQRGGSLDSDIVPESEVPNDFPRLLSDYPTVRAIAFNGGKSAQAFRKHVVPILSADVLSRVDLIALPSTSPANASQSVAQKIERWRVLLSYVD